MFDFDILNLNLDNFFEIEKKILCTKCLFCNNFYKIFSYFDRQNSSIEKTIECVNNNSECKEFEIKLFFHLNSSNIDFIEICWSQLNFIYSQFIFINKNNKKITYVFKILNTKKRTLEKEIIELNKLFLLKDIYFNKEKLENYIKILNIFK